MSYHMPLVIAFSVRQRISFVWGGCMLFRAQHMRDDSHGIIKARWWCREGRRREGRRLCTGQQAGPWVPGGAGAGRAMRVRVQAASVSCPALWLTCPAGLV
jgi:hypothetical protein